MSIIKVLFFNQSLQSAGKKSFLLFFPVCDKQNPWDCCSNSNPCRENEGDCDNDNDCLGNLKCGHGNGLEDNCDNSFAEGADCCYDPKYNATLSPSTTNEPTTIFNGK